MLSSKLDLKLELSWSSSWDRFGFDLISILEVVWAAKTRARQPQNGPRWVQGDFKTAEGGPSLALTAYKTA